MHNNTKLKLNPKQQELYKVSKIEKIYPEYYQTDLHHQASIYESTYVLGEIQGMKKGFDPTEIAEISGSSEQEVKDILSTRSAKMRLV